MSLPLLPHLTDGGVPDDDRVIHAACCQVLTVWRPLDGERRILMHREDAAELAGDAVHRR
jgi:hypothetical protein